MTVVIATMPCIQNNPDCCNPQSCGPCAMGECMYPNKCSKDDCITNVSYHDHLQYFSGGVGPVCRGCGMCLRCCTNNPDAPLLSRNTCWACDACTSSDAKLQEVCKFCDMCDTCHIKDKKCIEKPPELNQCPTEGCTNFQWADDLCPHCWVRTGQHAHTKHQPPMI